MVDVSGVGEIKKEWFVYLQKCGDFVYIGKTNNPKRRLRQHNGEISGGANRTKRMGPWKHQYLISGFKSQREALQFEWALQHIHKSKHFRDKRVSCYKDAIDILNERFPGTHCAPGSESPVTPMSC